MKKKLLAVLFFLSASASISYGAVPTQAIDIRAITSPQVFSNSIQLLLTLSLITLVPFFLISVTSFLRIIIVLSLIRVAVGTQQVPPNPIIIGLALFMTVFIMTPVWQEVNTKALIPYNQNKISQAKAFEAAINPVRTFMFKQTRESDLALFIQFSRVPQPKQLGDVPTYVLIPAFMISELKTAFSIGFLIFVPFLVIDLVVANVLLSLGMFMLSPVMVSLPFKILLFVLSDGWALICRGLMMSFK